MRGSILMSQNDTSILKINDEQGDYARKISAALSKPAIRREGLIDLLGVICAADYFTKQGFKVNIARSLHAIPEIFEEFRITDIYINNYRIDIISQFREDKIKIPDRTREYECLPDYYVVVQMTPRLKDVKIAGYIKPQDIAFIQSQEGYIEVDTYYLKSIATLEESLLKPAQVKPVFGKHTECMALFLRFIDKELSFNNKKLLINHLATCPACTRKLADIISFDKSVKNIPNASHYMQKYVSPLKNPDDAYESIRATIDADGGQENKEHFIKGIIDAIFNKTEKADIFSASNSAASDTKKKFTISAVVVFVFILLSLFIAYKSSSQDVSSISDIDDYSSQEYYDESAQEDFASSHTLPQEVYGSQSTPDYALAGQTTGEPLVATINKVSWEIPENLANKANYTKFLQLAGKSIKLNLQNDLLLSSDFAKNNVIKISIRIASSGDIIEMKVLQGSGSEPIDDIIQKSISETFAYMKPPSHGFISRPVDVVLVVNL